MKNEIEELYKEIGKLTTILAIEIGAREQLKREKKKTQEIIKLKEIGKIQREIRRKTEKAVKLKIKEIEKQNNDKSK